MPIENSLLKIQYISRSLVYHQSLHFTSGEITITHFIISEKEMLVWSKTDVKQFWVCPATDDVTDCEAKNEADQQHCIHSGALLWLFIIPFVFLWLRNTLTPHLQMSPVWTPLFLRCIYIDFTLCGIEYRISGFANKRINHLCYFIFSNTPALFAVYIL